MFVRIEYTDTFAGEANYSWVKRGSIRLDGSLSDKQVLAQAKKMMGLSGVRGKTVDIGDCVSFRPHGMNTVLYVIYDSVED
jgi:hypothetical protein